MRIEVAFILQETWRIINIEHFGKIIYSQEYIEKKLETYINLILHIILLIKTFVG